MADDYYKTLGVARGASPSEIQKAYRELARKYHPDMNPDNPEEATKKFQEIQAAFDVLNDPEKREMYDRYGSSFETRGAGGGPRPGGQWSSTQEGGEPGPQWFEDGGFAQFFGDRFSGAGTPGDFSDIFRHFQGGASAAPRGRRAKAGQSTNRGGDLSAEIEIPFTTAVSGGEVQLSLQRQPGHTETLSVKIPAGIEDGKKIRLRGQGDPGVGGNPGDLLVMVHVAPHSFFQRRGNDLLVRVPITLGEAAQGAKIDLPTPAGTVSLHVPPGTSSGTKLRVRGHGVTSKAGKAGDLLAEIQVTVPKQLSDADRKLLAEIDHRYPQDPRAALRW